jgi:hypothetical protein
MAGLTLKMFQKIKSKMGKICVQIFLVVTTWMEAMVGQQNR